MWFPKKPWRGARRGCRVSTDVVEAAASRGVAAGSSSSLMPGPSADDDGGSVAVLPGARFRPLRRRRARPTVLVAARSARVAPAVRGDVDLGQLRRGCRHSGTCCSVLVLPSLPLLAAAVHHRLRRGLSVDGGVVARGRTDLAAALQIASRKCTRSGGLIAAVSFIYYERSRRRARRRVRLRLAASAASRGSVTVLFSVDVAPTGRGLLLLVMRELD